MIKQIATVAVYVEDQQAALKFWTEQVGFEVRRNDPMGPNVSWIEVAPKGAESALVIYPRAMKPDWNELKPSIVFIAGEIQKAYDEMSARGVEFKEAPKAMPWGTFAIFRDPSGHEYVLKG